LNHEYSIRGATKLAVYSFEGASVQVQGICQVEYISEETVTVLATMSLHGSIEALRETALKQQADSPRVLILGSSRSTITRMLLNYAVRAVRTPLAVDVDVDNVCLSDCLFCLGKLVPFRKSFDSGLGSSD